MKEPLSHKIFAVLEPQEKAPVTGFLVQKKDGASTTLNIGKENIKLKGSDYHLTLPLGVGISTKNFGIWNVIQPELPAHLMSNVQNIDFVIPASNDVKLSYKGSQWLIVLDRDYSKVDIAAQRNLFFKKLSKFSAWLCLAFGVHILLYYFALTVPLKPFSWIEDTVAQSGSTALPSFEEQVIDEAKKNTALEGGPAEEEYVKVKFNFFNGLPWMDQKKVEKQNVQRLDALLKDLKGKDVTIGFDNQGAKSAAEVLKNAKQGGGGQKGGLISKVFSKSNALVNPKLSQLQSTNRNLSAAELKLIRATFQQLAPEMTLAYQRALNQNPQLAFGLRYETTVNAKGNLAQVRFQTSGVTNPAGLSDLLKEIKDLFERTSIGTGLSGVTIQGENVFRN